MLRIILFFLITINLGYGQAYYPVGTGLSTRLSLDMDVEVSGDSLYVVETFDSPGTGGFQLALKIWDGIIWQIFPTTLVPTGNIHDMEVFQNEVYVAIGSAGTAGFMKFDGDQWLSVPFWTGTGEVKALETHNGELLIGGDFNLSIGPSNFENILGFDGIGYTSYPGRGASEIFDLHIHNNTIHCLSDSLYAWDGAVWDNPASFVQGTNLGNPALKEITTYNGELYGVGDTSYFYKLANDTALLLNIIGNYRDRITDFDVYNNELYICADSTYDLSGASGRITIFDGQNFTTSTGPNRLREGAAFHGEMYYFSSVTTTHLGINHFRAYRFKDDWGVIKGYVYDDLDGNCGKLLQEPGVPNAIVQIGGIQVTTNALGQYAFPVPPGIYYVDTVYAINAIGQNLNMVCGNIGNPINITPKLSLHKWIPIRNFQPRDGGVFFNGYTGWRTRHGFTEAYKLIFLNLGYQPLGAVTASVEIPATLNVISVNPTPSSVVGNKYSFNFPATNPIEKVSAIFLIEIDTTLNNIGDSIQFNAEVAGITGDVNLTNNADTLYQEIVAAFDPNDKLVNKEFIRPSTNAVDYHIRFQNTGNDTAYKVLVVDTLDNTLPLTQIVIKSASHPYNLIIDNNTLIWEFDNIRLPDSTTNLLGSQGFVRFSAGLNPSLGVGDSILNDAQIYFDYQKPVFTNHAKTIIIDDISLPEHSEADLRIDVYPNPAREIINIYSQATFPITFDLINQSGMLIDQIQVTPFEKTVYQISNLPDGVYILKSDGYAYRILIR